MKNWANDVEFEPNEVLRPRDASEVRDAVVRARREGKKIRCIGRLHSSSEIIAADDICLSTERMNRILSIDTDKKRVVIEPGVQVRPLIMELELHGLALKNTGGVLVQSMAGALTCDTHGTGRDNPPLNAMVARYKFIDGRGEEVEVTEADDAFWAIGVSLGMVGVITEIELRCVPTFFLRSQVTVLDFSDLPANVLAESEQYPRLQYFWYPQPGKVVRQVMFDADDPGPDVLRKSVRTRHNFDRLFSVMTTAMGAFVPLRRPGVSALLGIFRRSEDLTLPSYTALSFYRFPKMYECEVAYDIQDAPRVLEYLAENIGSVTKTKKVSVGIRFCAASRCYLSPVHARDSMYVTLLSTHPSSFGGVIDFQTEVARRFGGRFHWGKKHPKDRDLILATYTEVDQFLEVLGRHDPDRVFMNPYLSHVFPD